jgi:transcriptional regulator GlxA family with amidase domain
MDVDRDASIEVVSLTDAPWSGFGATFSAARVRPPLDAFDVLVVAGGPAVGSAAGGTTQTPETRTLEKDAAVVAWLRSFPESRMAASVCTGALLLGAAGRLRGKRATTHHASLARLSDFEATIGAARVVRDGLLMTAGGVTSGIDLGLELVRWLYGDDARARIAARMEYPPPPT